MAASRAIQKKVEAQNLPRGHYLIKKTQEDVNKIYSQCRTIERKWLKRFHKKFQYLSANHIRELYDYLCELLGEQKVKEIICDKSQLDSGTSGHYNFQKKKVYFYDAPVCLSTIIHELTHHFGIRGHGDDFCEIEQLLFRETYEILMKKQPKKDW